MIGLLLGFVTCLLVSGLFRHDTYLLMKNKKSVQIEIIDLHRNIQYDRSHRLLGTTIQARRKLLFAALGGGIHIDNECVNRHCRSPSINYVHKYITL